jgi:Ca-activated chloride channel family protein
VVRDAPTVTGAALVPVGAVLSAAALLNAGAVLRSHNQDRPTFRAGARTVAVYATVQDRGGRLVPNLTRDDFQMLDDGTPVEPTVFSNDLQDITVALLLDMSASVAGEFSRIREAARHFVDQLRPADRVRIGTFGAEVALSPWLTGDRARLLRIIDEELWPGGSTPLYAALDAAMTSLEAEPGRRVLLAITDGADVSSVRRERRETPALVDRRATDAGFMVYAIGLEGPGLAGSIVRLADDTGGGRFELTRNADLAPTMARVVEELRHQYVLGFVPARLDGRTHRLEVRMRQPGLVARARRSYVAEIDR